MRCIIQRVNSARVFVDEKLISSIDRGILLYVGFCRDEKDEDLLTAAEKIVHLRIFEDEEKRFNLSLGDIKGEILCVSQFTLYADLGKGRRPSFESAEGFQRAGGLYKTFCKSLESLGFRVKMGLFGAYMRVVSENYGPATFMMDTQLL